MLAVLLQFLHGDATAQSANSNLSRLLEAELSRLPTRSGIYVKQLDHLRFGRFFSETPAIMT